LFKGFVGFKKSFDILFSQQLRDMINDSLDVGKRDQCKRRGRRRRRGVFRFRMEGRVKYLLI
jgi:class 3 adenylate cyclase